jgi:hypothetical protein
MGSAISSDMGAVRHIRGANRSVAWDFVADVETKGKRGVDLDE